MTLKALFRLSLFSVGALTSVLGCYRDISGTYLASDQSGVASLELVRTPDHHLTGQFVGDQINPDGTIQRKATGLTGAVDGENVSLTFAGVLGLGSTTLTGTLSGDTLTLTGPHAQPLIFKRSSLRDYQAQLSALDVRSQAIHKAEADAEVAQKNAREQRNFVDAVDHLAAHMQRIDSATNSLLSRFSEIEERYKTITAKISTYVERERRLSGNPSESIGRATLDVDAYQAAIDTTQLHNRVFSFEEDFKINAKPVAETAAAYENGCQSQAVEHPGFTSAELEARNAACGRLHAALLPFQQSYSALQSGLVHLEQVYIRENSTQQALLHTADALE
jgi:hypothetical protein